MSADLIPTNKIIIDQEVSQDNLQYIQETSVFIQEKCNLFENHADNFHEMLKILDSIDRKYTKSFKTLVIIVEKMTERCGDLNRRLMAMEDIKYEQSE